MRGCRDVRKPQVPATLNKKIIAIQNRKNYKCRSTYAAGRRLKCKETFKNEWYDMMGVRGVSAAYSRPTSTTRQSHKSQLNSAVHKRKMTKQRILKWGADTVINFLKIHNSYEVLWDTNGRTMEIISKRMQGDTI